MQRSNDGPFFHTHQMPEQWALVTVGEGGNGGLVAFLVRHPVDHPCDPLAASSFMQTLRFARGSRMNSDKGTGWDKAGIPPAGGLIQCCKHLGASAHPRDPWFHSRIQGSRRSCGACRVLMGRPLQTGRRNAASPPVAASECLWATSSPRTRVRRGVGRAACRSGGVPAPSRPAPGSGAGSSRAVFHWACRNNAREQFGRAV